MRKRLWSPDEDEKLQKYVSQHGFGNWSEVAKKTGLQRCGKSCRLRWINYLRPDLKRGKLSQEEKMIIVNLQKVFGNSWSKIAAHLPGRTDSDIKNFWHSHFRKMRPRTSAANGMSGSSPPPAATAGTTHLHGDIHNNNNNNMNPMAAPARSMHNNGGGGSILSVGGGGGSIIGAASNSSSSAVMLNPNPNSSFAAACSPPPHHHHLHSVVNNPFHTHILYNSRDIDMVSDAGKLAAAARNPTSAATAGLASAFCSIQMNSIHSDGATSTRSVYADRNGGAAAHAPNASAGAVAAGNYVRHHTNINNYNNHAAVFSTAAGNHALLPCLEEDSGGRRTPYGNWVQQNKGSGSPDQRMATTLLQPAAAAAPFPNPISSSAAATDSNHHASLAALLLSMEQSKPIRSALIDAPSPLPPPPSDSTLQTLLCAYNSSGGRAAAADTVNNNAADVKAVAAAASDYQQPPPPPPPSGTGDCAPGAIPPRSAAEEAAITALPEGLDLVVWSCVNRPNYAMAAEDEHGAHEMEIQDEEDEEAEEMEEEEEEDLEEEEEAAEEEEEGDELGDDGMKEFKYRRRMGGGGGSNVASLLAAQMGGGGGVGGGGENMERMMRLQQQQQQQQYNSNHNNNNNNMMRTNTGGGGNRTGGGTMMMMMMMGQTAAAAAAAGGAAGSDGVRQLPGGGNEHGHFLPLDMLLN